MAKDVRRTEEPDDYMGDLAKNMLEVIEDVPNLRAIVMILNDETREAMTAQVGFEDPHETVMALLQFTEAYAKGEGVPFAVMPAPGLGAQG
jgi:hypothetical protein